jgi:hypothetical protein
VILYAAGKITDAKLQEAKGKIRQLLLEVGRRFEVRRFSGAS